MHTAAMGRTQKQDDEQRIDQQDIFRLCRKVGFWRTNPKIGYQKINDLRVSTFLFSVICDRAKISSSACCSDLNASSNGTMG
jgi:hypothetical protein